MAATLTLRAFVASTFIAVNAAHRQTSHGQAVIASTSTGNARTGVALSQQFEEYVKDHNRGYAPGSREFEMRRFIFLQRVASIEAQNSKVGRLWTAGINGLTDRTEEELAMLRGLNRFIGHGPKAARGSVAMGLIAESAEEEMPESLPEVVDWRNLAMASDVPDQGSCGSCWAVAAATLLTARHATQRLTSRSFSAQQLVSCVQNPEECGGNGGCKGATVQLAMQYVELMGLDSEENEPYMGADNVECKRPTSASKGASFLAPSGNVASVVTDVDSVPRSWHTLPENKAAPLMRALVDGPVAVSVAASDWFMYLDGIFDSCKKDAIVNHAVVAFGYGKDGEQHYWTIRNSWGKTWGEGGFMRLFRQATPEAEDEWCGVDHEPEKGIACKPYPKEVKVCGMCAIIYDSVVVDFRGNTNARVIGRNVSSGRSALDGSVQW